MLKLLRNNSRNIIQTINYKIKSKSKDLTESDCLTFVINNLDCYASLQFVPVKFRTKKICEVAVGKDKYNLRYVPKKIYNICYNICYM